MKSLIKYNPEESAQLSDCAYARFYKMKKPAIICGGIFVGVFIWSLALAGFFWHPAILLLPLLLCLILDGVIRELRSDVRRIARISILVPMTLGFLCLAAGGIKGGNPKVALIWIVYAVSAVGLFNVGMKVRTGE